MKKYKFIFWDMDGTMANTYEGVKNCLEKRYENAGIARGISSHGTAVC